MPELPEVETFARFFADHALRQTIRRVLVRDERILTDLRAETFRRKLQGRKFTKVRRHGKHLFAETAGAAAGSAPLWLHLHFGMSGDLSYVKTDAEEPRFARVLFQFTNAHQLVFEDMRLFGRAGLVASPDAYIESAGLGPDPLSAEFTAARFEEGLKKRKGAIKALLMSQEVVAGLGNLYVDEVLFQTGIHPRRAADRITAAERRAVYTSMKKILRETIARHARSADHPPSFLIRHRETGERCPKCGGTIRRMVVFGRTTYYCATHQR
jgi:formamidopyrimidine-DNA glycosylase